MKTRLNEVSKRFFTNEKERTIVCKLECSIDINYALPFDYAWCDDSDSYKSLEKLYQKIENLNTVITEQNTIKFSVTAKCKCHYTDEFDVDFGTKLALTKAQSKAFEKAAKIYAIIFDFVYDKFCDEYDELASNCWTCKNDSDTHMEKLIDERFNR